MTELSLCTLHLTDSKPVANQADSGRYFQKNPREGRLLAGDEVLEKANPSRGGGAKPGASE